MTLGVLGLAALLGVPLLLGLGLLRRVGFELGHDLLATFAAAYLAGCVALGAVLTLWLALAWPLEARLVLPVVGLAGALLFGLPRRSPGAPARASRPAWPLLVALVVAGALSLARILDAARLPVLTADEAVIFAHKAKILFDVGGLGEALAARARQQGITHFDYPALDPLLQLFSFVLGGKILLIENRFLVQLSSLALVALLASGLRARLRPVPAAVLLCVALTAPVLRAGARNCAADVMTALGLLGALEFGLRWRRSRARGDLGATALALAFLVWSKNEGLLYAAMVVLALCASTRPRAREAAWLLVPGLVVLGTWSFNLAHGFHNDVINASAGEQLASHAAARFPPVVAYFGRLLFLEPQSFHFVFALLALALLFHPRALVEPELRVSALVVGALVAGHFVIYLLTPNELEWHLETSAARVLGHGLPVAVLALAQVAAAHPWLGPRLASELHQPELA
jgi:hypothetical protein